jgi:hypothetical protein
MRRTPIVTRLHGTSADGMKATFHPLCDTSHVHFDSLNRVARRMDAIPYLSPLGHRHHLVLSSLLAIALTRDTTAYACLWCASLVRRRLRTPEFEKWTLYIIV